MLEMKKALLDYRTVRRFHLDVNPKTYRYDLFLQLSRGEAEDGITVLFEDVQSLRLKDFGGGLTNFSHLVVDPDNSGSDRVHFKITEVEEDAISFLCADVRVL